MALLAGGAGFWCLQQSWRSLTNFSNRRQISQAHRLTQAAQIEALDQGMQGQQSLLESLRHQLIDLQESQQHLSVKLDEAEEEAANWRQELVDRLADERNEDDAHQGHALQQLIDWRMTDAEPKLAACTEVAALVPPLQQQVIAISESLQGLQPWVNQQQEADEAIINAIRQIGARLADLEEKTELMESLVGAQPPRRPTPPMGPPPSGTSSAELQELMARQAELQNNFLARQARRNGMAQIPLPANQ